MNRKTVSRRAFIGVATAGTVGWLSSSSSSPSDTTVSESGQTIDSGKGFLAYVPDASSGWLLFRHLDQRGFHEKMDQSRLHVQISGVAENRFEATVASTLMSHPELGRAIVTHVVGSRDPRLRWRKPQAYIWPHGATRADPVTLQVVDGKVVLLR